MASSLSISNFCGGIESSEAFALLLLNRKHIPNHFNSRRYERWNPVHPTSGAFWGVGVGIGCGVGWGPGFGPEVIGYVGSGCGVGFSVGITFLGIGIGLPANYLLEVPHSAFRRGACHVAQAAGLLGKNGCEGDGWGHVFETLQNPCASFSTFKIGDWTEKNTIDLPGMKSTLVLNAKQIVDHLQKVGHFGPWDRGSKT